MSRSKPHRIMYFCIDKWARYTSHKQLFVGCVKTTWLDSAVRYFALGQKPPGAELFDVISVSVFR